MKLPNAESNQFLVFYMSENNFLGMICIRLLSAVIFNKLWKFSNTICLLIEHLLIMLNLKVDWLRLVIGIFQVFKRLDPTFN